MKRKQKIFAAVLSCVMLTATAGGCTEENSVQPNKDVMGEDTQSEENSAPSVEDTDEEVLEQIDNIDDSTETGEVYSQTIMVYMVGSDLESGYGAATMDLAEMEEAMPETGDHHIVVCAGGAAEWQNSMIFAEDQTLLELKDGAFSVVDTLESKNMGEAENLGSFVKQCMTQYDTDMYSLILWDHGAGPVLGFGVDENYGDIMTLAEMQAALENSVGESGKKLEWIGFDACLMSSLELADAFAPYANYMIASQETEPGWGWNYEFLSSLSEPDMNGARLSREIIDTYMEYSEAVFAEDSRYYADLTLSCLDLNQYQAAEDALNTFFAETHQALSVTTFPQAVRDRDKVKEFGGFSASYNYSLVDMVNLVETLAVEDSAAEDAALEALNNMTVYMRTNVANAGGVSVCYPFGAEEDYKEYCLTLQENIGFASSYTDFLRDFYAIQNGETIAEEWDVADAHGEVHVLAVPSNDTSEEEEISESSEESSEEISSESEAESSEEISSEMEAESSEESSEAVTEEENEEPASLGPASDISLQLTPEQMDNFGSATYYILCKAEDSGFVTAEEDERADDMYVFVHGGKNVTMDSSGVLHAYYSNNVVYMRDTETGELPTMPMVLIDNDSSSEEKRYLTSVVLTAIADDISDWNIQAANLQIVVDSNHPEGEIRSAVPIHSDEEIERASKQLLNLDDFTYMAVTGRCSYLTRDENGNLLPFFDWEESGWLMGFEQDLTTGYELEVMPIQNPENFVCMFVVTDSQGNSSVSELIPLG